jgi:hypothetical protein
MKLKAIHIQVKNSLRMKSQFLLLFSCIFCTANAADIAGRYLVSGVGKDSCRSYVDADVVGKSYYRTWLSGYISSYNYTVEDTYSVVNKKSVEELETWLRGYCFSNTNDTYEQAVKNLMRKLEYFKKKNFYDK